jgi:hypothetical protein
MQLQEIVISPDIFEKIGRAFNIDSEEDIDLKSYRENLDLKKIVFENSDDGGSSILNSIRELMEKHGDFGKKKIDSVLRSFLKPGRHEFRTIEQPRKYCTNEITNTILNLGLQTESRIINTQDKTPSALSLKHTELSELELLDIDESIHPGFNSRVLCREKTLKFKRGETINYERYFVPYISHAETLTINDRYLRIRNGGFMNLKRLLKLMINLKKIEIRTITGNDLDKFKPDITCDEVQNEIRNIHMNAVIKIIGKAAHERFLETEHCRITIDPGFDFVNEQYVAGKNDVTIHFKLKDISDKAAFAETET